MLSFCCKQALVIQFVLSENRFGSCRKKAMAKVTEVEGSKVRIAGLWGFWAFPSCLSPPQVLLQRERATLLARHHLNRSTRNRSTGRRPRGKSCFPSCDAVVPVQQLSTVRMGTAASRATLWMTRTVNVLLGDLHAKVI